MYQRILVPSDGSKLSDRAVSEAVNFAKAIGAKITVLHVMPKSQMFLDESFVVPVTTSQSLKDRFKKQVAVLAEEILDKARAQAAAAGVECDAIAVASDSPFDAIIKRTVKSNCDLIVMASHGRRGLSGVLLGSETSKVLVHSRIPVLVVR